MTVSGRLPRLISGLLCLLPLAAPARGQAPEVALAVTPEFTSAPPGSAVRVALRLTVPEGWHIGWINAGRRGIASQLSWHVERALLAGQPAWPVPELDSLGDSTANVYRGELLVITPFRVAPTAPVGVATLRGKVTLGLCRERCVTRQDSVTTSITIDTAAAVSSPEWSQVEAVAAETAPVSLRPRMVHAAFDRDSVRLTILLPGGPPSRTEMTFFPLEPGHAAIVTPAHTGPAASWVRLPLTARDGVGRIAGLLVAPEPWGAEGPVAFAMDVHVQGRPPSGHR